LSLDESIGKIEVDPKEEASVVEVFQDVLDKLSDVGKKDKLLKFYSNAMLFKGNFPSCTNLKNFNSLSFFPTSESLSRTSWKTSTTEASSFGSTSFRRCQDSRERGKGD
jgi:hypothetical protein